MRMADIAKPYLSRKGSVTLDLGCGTGLFEEAAGIRSIIGVDFSPTLLSHASRRMDTIWQKNIFDLKLVGGSVDNVVSLFMIDDYPRERKLEFFRQIHSLLRRGGHLFFAAYSPDDERMGKRREEVNRKTGARFEIHLEDASFYKEMLGWAGIAVLKAEIVRTRGQYRTDSRAELMELKREFILIVGQKRPLAMRCSG